MKFVVEINQKKYQVEVERGQATLVQEAPAATSAPAPPAAAAPSGLQGEKIAAPIPGVVVKVHVEAGGPVKKGQPILVLEAMKMENNIVAPRDGTVAFAVASGTHVSVGDLLAIIR